VTVFFVVQFTPNSVTFFQVSAKMPYRSVDRHCLSRARYGGQVVGHCVQHTNHLVEFAFRVLETPFDTSDRIFVNANAVRKINIRLKKHTTEKNPGKKPSGLLARREQLVNTIHHVPSPRKAAALRLLVAAERVRVKALSRARSSLCDCWGSAAISSRVKPVDRL